MTLKELAAVIGREGKFSPIAGFIVNVRVTDARQVYGRTDYAVVPLSGEGLTWIESKRVHLNGQQEATQ